MLHYQRNALPPNTQEQQPDQLAADIAKRRKVGHSSNETDVKKEEESEADGMHHTARQASSTH